jgi:Flp pilus assembly protein TadG
MIRPYRRHRRGGVAGLEFALLSPVLLTLFLGTIDLSGALVTARRMASAAGAVAQIGTVGGAQTKALNVLTDMQAWQATTAAFALFPGWTTKAAYRSFAITLSAVNFVAAPVGCTLNCTYTAKVAWSVANPLGAPQLRACGTLTKVPNSTVTSYSTLPAGDFGVTSLLVADISYTFTPSFFGFLIGDIPMMQSAYISPRIDNGIALVPAGGPGVNVICKDAG